jgi:hypothetical protein
MYGVLLWCIILLLITYYVHRAHGCFLNWTVVGSEVPRSGRVLQLKFGACPKPLGVRELRGVSSTMLMSAKGWPQPRGGGLLATHSAQHVGVRPGHANSEAREGRKCERLSVFIYKY